MRTELITVTPDMAKAWLEKNIDNRPMNPRKVAQFEQLLRDGKAATTHQGAAINVRGELQDGQKRFAAIVNTGIPWTMQVSFDCPVENFHYVDVGENRSVAQLLYIRGYRKDYKHVKAVGEIAWYWYHGKAGFSGQPNDEELAQFFEAYPDVVEIPRVGKPDLGVPGALLSFMGYIAPSKDFMADLLSETPDSTTHGGALALRYMKRKKELLKKDKKTQMALFVKAANTYLSGQEIPARGWRFTQADQFPPADWETPILFAAGANEDDE